MSSVSDTTTGTIGIKIANGAYYPILQEGSSAKKRLVLTTVKDNQSSVQIDLYKGRGEEIEDAVYIGSLVIEDIEPASGGEPEIELSLGLDSENNLSATAADKSTGDTQSLSVSLESLDNLGIYDIPEFDLEEDFTPESVLSREEETRLHDDYSDDQTHYAGREGKSRLRLFGLILLLIGLALLTAFLLFSYFGSGEPDSEQTAAQEPAAEAPPAPVSPPIVQEQPAEPVQPSPPPAPEMPDTPSADATGVWYQLQWGDTLWDLSSSFYRDPFLYGQIAAENEIANPDLIFAGRDIYIPDPRR
ncbi:Hsp70 family protein [Marispirochaeta sp.]|uniref:Hsp70 family protein n=1 Tax=Marispirochaeta sp. TaxID=2038653 RepID=UPI0029C63772|nr:Hsp70 family protein [Marispirochaeta sp.]